MRKKEIIICRCEDINLEELHSLMEQGFTSIEDLKRQLRVGMGPCQGATCLPLIQRELATFLKKPIEEIPLPTVRPLIIGVPLKAIARGAKDEA